MNWFTKILSITKAKQYEIGRKEGALKAVEEMKVNLNELDRLRKENNILHDRVKALKTLLNDIPSVKQKDNENSKC